MDRPSSQMENVRPSGLKQPSRLPTVSTTTNRALLETSQSELNTKMTKEAMMMPPPVINGKHKMNNLPESAPKRKTLVERAGELPVQSRSHAPQSRSIGTTLPQAARAGTNGHQYRGSVSRPQGHYASQIQRPMSAMNGSVTSSRYAAKHITTSLDNGEEDEEESAEAIGRRKVWDTQGRLEDIDKTLAQFQDQLVESTNSKAALEEMIVMLKAKVEELQRANQKLNSEQQIAISDLDRARQDLQITTTDLQQARRDNERDQSDADRRHERELLENQVRHDKQLQRLEREGERAIEQLENEIKEMKKSLEKQKVDEITDLQSEHWDEIDQLRVKHDLAIAALKKDLEQLKKSDEGRAAESATEVQNLKDSIVALQGQIQVSSAINEALRSQIAMTEGRNAVLEQERANLVSKAHFLEGNQEAQSQEFTNMTHRLQEAEAQATAAIEQLRKEEMVRRRLNAQILELKGNIRVFARIRPVLANEEGPAKVEYPDVDELDGKKEMIVHAPTTFTATGKERNEKYPYGFDRVYNPEASNSDVFEDCRDLVQSVIDGYNVSILSYGQTGSGKTYGMSGADGIIPSSISLLLSEIDRLRQKGWEYRVCASFVEVYNETLNDLLGDAKRWDNEEDLGAATRTRSKARHEIHHDSVTGKTTVTNLTSTTLWPPQDGTRPDGDDTSAYTKYTVERLLETATKNRRVAATKANERSSRSHSVFVLTLHGTCDATGESSEGILNLVDLAGSERLKHSGAEGSRAKETAAINTSLKSLGDVIEKIGSGGHVPYRNSKLTYLLQSSLGGTAANGKSSRTLMLLHLSPLQAHWQETKTSLQFGTKVHGTHIGTAKRK